MKKKIVREGSAHQECAPAPVAGFKESASAAALQLLDQYGAPGRGPGPSVVSMLDGSVAHSIDWPGVTALKERCLAFGINANLVHKWRRLAQREVVATGPAPTPRMPTPTFIPLVIGAPTTSRPTDPIPQEQLQEVRIELRGGAFAATVTWPMSANAECAGWLRKLLR